MEKKSCHQQILDTLAEKSSTKQLVYRNTVEVFDMLKSTLKKVAETLNGKICDIDNHVVVEYKEAGKNEAEITFSGDTLVFHMHTNAFGFEKDHPIHQTGYIKEDPLRGYVGVIHIYNFLSDSLKHNRLNDIGFLIGRIFINKENHFFVEGKKKLGFLFNNFALNPITEKDLHQIIEESILYSLKFDLTTPAFRDVQLITVDQKNSMSTNFKVSTSKKLGFKMKYDKEDEG